jgi:hypothetical protein
MCWPSTRRIWTCVWASSSRSCACSSSAPSVTSKVSLPWGIASHSLHLTEVSWCLLTVEDITSKRVVFYGALECVVYLVVCFAQVYYIKSLLDTPRKVRSWV